MQSRRRPLECSEPSAAGRDLGVINQKYFQSATWEPLLSTELGRGQYSKFVASMIERIHLKESSYDEIRSFVHLIATEHNWDFMKLAMPHLSELKEQYPHDTKNFDIALLFLLKPKIRRRSIKDNQSTTPATQAYKDGLSKTEEQLLRRSLFGAIPEAVETPGIARLFKSTLELGYPQPALDQSLRRAKEQGTDIERCCVGLPMNMLMPRTDNRPDTFSSSSLHRHDSGTAEVWNPDSNFEQLKIQLSSTNAVSEPIDSPPRELLTELAIDGIDPPVPTIPDKIRTSDGELLTLSGIENIEASVSRRTESPKIPRVPRDESPHTQCRSPECEAFKGCYKDSSSGLLNYFHLLERLPNPQMPYQMTRLARLTLDARVQSHFEASPDGQECKSDTKA